MDSHRLCSLAGCLISTNSPEPDAFGCDIAILHKSGVQGAKPLAGARGVLANFPFPYLPPQAAQETYLSSYYSSIPDILASTLYTTAKSCSASPIARAAVRYSLLAATV